MHDYGVFIGILLLKNIRESLAGRCLIVELYPLTLPEMLTDKWEDPVTLSYYQSILSGQSKTMIPFLLDNDHVQKKEILDTYLKFRGYPAIMRVFYFLKRKMKMSIEFNQDAH